MCKKLQAIHLHLSTNIHVDNKYIKVIQGLLSNFKYIKLLHLNFGKSEKGDKKGFENLIKSLKR